MILFSSIYPDDQPEYVIWLSIVGSLLFGCIYGYIAQKYARVGILFIGTWIGGLIGGIIYGAVVQLFLDDS